MVDELLRGHAVVVPVPVAWGDLDAFGHVNNTRYFRWFEDGRIAFFDAVGIQEIKDRTGVGPILASTSCRFRIPLTYPDRVHVGADVSAYAADRFTMTYVVVSEQHGRIAAEGEGQLVAFDYRAGRKSEYPDELRVRIEDLHPGRPGPTS
jgi:acyl-CoA thioester hydrolase